jgi:putative phosphoribosyl transferase
MVFTNRIDAGRRLAEKLGHYGKRRDVLVLGLPRGGVPVAYEVARALNAELDVLVVRKLGVPFHPELAMGAIASGGGVSVNENVLTTTGVTERQFEQVRAAEHRELQRREHLFRGARTPVVVQGRVVIVVDDGLATGATMRAALTTLRTLKPARLVVAVPVAPARASRRFADVCDEFVCVEAPDDFSAVGQFYQDFGQTSDDEVRELLGQTAADAK